MKMKKSYLNMLQSIQLCDIPRSS